MEEGKLEVNSLIVINKPMTGNTQTGYQLYYYFTFITMTTEIRILVWEWECGNENSATGNTAWVENSGEMVRIGHR